MSDVFDKNKRSEIMASIRSKNTKAEILTFQYLRKNGIYFQKHYSNAPGRPDIALPRKKRACFIDGDFWHGRSLAEVIRRRGECDYWSLKISRNMERDKSQRLELESNDWAVLSVWESDIMRKRTREQTLMEIKNFLIID